MKPTSIVFLIVALALVIGGFATAGIAKQIAASEGIDLSVDVGDGGEGEILTYEYGSDSIGKIAVSLKNANVNVIGGAEKAYVERINFTEGMFELSPNNRVLTINDTIDITSLSGITTMALNFRGLRSFVSSYNMRNLEKTVNIYVSDSIPVNIIDIELGSGDVSARDITAAADYAIDIDAGNVTLENINTTSAVTVEIDSGDVNAKGCDIEQMSIDIGSGNIRAQAKINRLDADIDSGDFNLEYSGSLNYINTRLFTSAGQITVDGEKLGGYRETSDVDTQNIIDISVSVGDIVINTGSSK